MANLLCAKIELKFTQNHISCLKLRSVVTLYTLYITHIYV